MDEIEAIDQFGVEPYRQCDCGCLCQTEVGSDLTTCPPCTASAHSDTPERETWIAQNFLGDVR